MLATKAFNGRKRREGEEGEAPDGDHRVGAEGRISLNGEGPEEIATPVKGTYGEGRYPLPVCRFGTESASHAGSLGN